MKTFFDVAARVLEFVILVLIVLFTAITLMQVIWRYFLGSPFTWTEEVCRYLFIWGIMLASAVTLRLGRHVRFDLLIDGVKGKPKAMIEIVINIMVLFFSVYIFIYGILLCVTSAGLKSGGLGVPLIYTYAAVPAGALFMTLFGFELLIRNIKLLTARRRGEGGNIAEKEA